MKILVCTFSFPCYEQGVPDGRFVYSEVAGYARNGASVTVLTPHFPGAPLVEHPEPGVTIRRFRYFFPASRQVARQPGRPIYDIASPLAIVQLPLMLLFFTLHILHLARQADLIHAQWTVTALLALPARWLTRTKLVVTARGSDIRLLPDWLNRFIFRQVDAAIDCFGPTDWNRANKKKFAARYVQLPLLILDDQTGTCPLELRNTPFSILYVGRFHPIKLEENHLPLLTLIDAARILKEKQRPFHLTYVGDGDARLLEQMQNGIRDHALESFVTIAGTRTDVMDYMHHANLGVGGIAFNGVAQEYTVCGTPQLLMDTSDNENTPWQHMDNCLLVEADNVSALTETLLWAMDHPEQLHEIGLRAKTKLSRHFAESGSGGRYYLEAFRKLVNG